jgi:hypothetical protein
MSKVSLAGNASGTGIFTIASPNSNTDRTINLPDATGTVQVSGNPISGTTGTFSGIIQANGGGVQFPATQVSSADANTLDDYEEGTFTPTVNFSTSSSGIVYDYQVGRYTKIGRLVTVQISISLASTGSSSGFCTIQGLPFVSAFISNGNFAGDGTTFTGAYLFSLTEASVSQMWVANQGGGTGSLAGWAYTYPALWSSGAKYISLTYITAT